MHNFKDKKIVILSHVLTTVPAEDLKQFFLKKDVNGLMFISHPLFYKKGRPGSQYQLYERGKQIKSVQHKNRKLPSIVQYIKDIILTLFWVIKTKKKYDLIIALDNLNSVAGLLLRKIGSVKKVIFYTIDFVPQRFNSRMLNNFYHYLDRIAVKNSNLTWNVSPRIKEGREKIRGLTGPEYAKQITVPIGAWLDRIEVKQFSDIEPHTLVYAGGLVEHQGVQVVLDAVPEIVKHIPDFKFLIIGLGDYEDELKKKAKDLAIEDYVHFAGYFEKHEDVEKRLSNSGLAVAMYNQALAKWSYYCDPTKIRHYLAAGLPVITTSLTHIIEDLKKYQCGEVIDYDFQKVSEAVIGIFSNPDKQRQMRDNAIKYSRDYDWEKVFDRAMEKI